MTVTYIDPWADEEAAPLRETISALEKAFPQLHTSGVHVENNGSVEIEKEATGEVEHKLGATPATFDLDFETTETPTGAGLWLTEKTSSKLKIHNGLNKKVKVYWKART